MELIKVYQKFRKEFAEISTSKISNALAQDSLRAKALAKRLNSPDSLDREKALRKSQYFMSELTAKYEAVGQRLSNLMTVNERLVFAIDAIRELIKVRNWESYHGQIKTLEADAAIARKNISKLEKVFYGYYETQSKLYGVCPSCF